MDVLQWEFKIKITQKVILTQINQKKKSLSVFIVGLPPINTIV
ncbi:hypothetical protein MPF_1810 [Methanohalophilus portucalensis FDF-1]|uniref:Uncharacterized protein n=1 Tax=Methanohalophilus portucalensis FDF-1 TaxID=523843 RepID=A0A1L9C2S3_9EURY|nr:hypothetical protein MPF_1810 [Methanohalophilus portucalensis FDF-1]